VGQTLTAWKDRVSGWLRDEAAIDADDRALLDAGLTPAWVQLAVDKPRVVAVDVAPSGRLVPIPTPAQGWLSTWSQIISVEAPAGLIPPQKVDGDEWSWTRDPSDPNIERLLLPAEVNGQVRLLFTTSWPIPTADPADDLIDPIGFEAVTSLAASMLCTSMASEAARGRQGALRTDFVDGSDRAQRLLDAGRALRIHYNTYIGLGQRDGLDPRYGGTVAGSSSHKTMRSVKLGGGVRQTGGAVPVFPESWLRGRT
jgi:hypothetical protein